jgi:hypothetical protein
MVEIKNLEEFKTWLLLQPSSVHHLAMKLASDGRCFTDFEKWISEFNTEYEATDWTCFPDAFENAEFIQWKAKAFTELRQWLTESKDHSKTIDLWAAVYIRCGACFRGFQEWVKANPYSEGWTERAIETIEKNRWI